MSGADNLSKAFITITDRIGLVQAVELYRTVLQLFTNIIDHPDEQKYRQLKCRNATLTSKVLSQRGGLDLLLAVGWKQRAWDFEEFLIFDDADLTLLCTAQEKIRKHLVSSEARVKTIAKPAVASSSSQQRDAVLAQIEQDRQERIQHEQRRSSNETRPPQK
jgi:hypothetical protein